MIRITQGTIVFDSRSVAGLHDVNLEIKSGQVFALMGPNGSGKTTLLNVISKRLQLDSGSLEVNGTIHFFEKREPPADQNVQKFLIAAVRTEIDVDKKVQLSRDMASIFEFTFQLRQTIGQLSQGQLQKVLMAAELINQPDILFLDEPFIHLDPMGRRDILEQLFTYLRQREATVVWITHEKDEALRFADTIGLIHHGKIEQVDSPVEILNRPRNLFVAQFFGHQNFIKISKTDGEWLTPWGTISSGLDGDEAFLVVPPISWKLDDASPFEVKILHIFPQYFVTELEVEKQDKRYKVSLPLAMFSKLTLGQTLALSADLSQCFVIPL